MSALSLRFLKISLLLCPLLGLAAPRTQDPALRLVPAKANNVVVFRLDQLLQKASHAQLMELEPYRALMEKVARRMETGADTRQLLETCWTQPEESGLHTRGNLYFFTVNPTEEHRLTGWAFGVTDAARLKDLLNQLGPGATWTKAAGYDIRVVGNAALAVGKTNGLLLISNGAYGEYAETYEAPYAPEGEAAPKPGKTREQQQRELLQGYLKQGKAARKTHDPAFRSFVSQVQDLGSFTNLSALAADPGIYRVLARELGQQELDLDRNWVSTQLRFDQGAIQIDLHKKLNTGLLAGMRPMAGPPLGAEVLAYVPGTELIGFAGISLHLPNLFYNLRKLSDKERWQKTVQELENDMAQRNLSLDRLSQVLRGQAWVFVTDLDTVLKMRPRYRYELSETVDTAAAAVGRAPAEVETDTSSTGTEQRLDSLNEGGDGSQEADQQPYDESQFDIVDSVSYVDHEPMLFVAVGVSSEADMQALLLDMGAPVEKSGQIYVMKKPDLYYTYVPGYMLLGTERAEIEAIASGQHRPNPRLTESHKKLTQGPLCAYINLNPGRMSPMLRAQASYFRSVEEAGTDYLIAENNTDAVRIRMKFANEDRNGLLGLFHLLAASKKWK
ncbi:MAG: DUF4836 family protein [Bacteroidetes bacterium]|jgi:hypothetical protein|nr:DUF4836 family protein [Bacteroidota bacterium]